MYRHDGSHVPGPFRSLWGLLAGGGGLLDECEEPHIRKACIVHVVALWWVCHRMIQFFKL